VWADDVLLGDQLDGRRVAVDPGNHVSRYEASGRATVDESVLISSGEQGRALRVRWPETVPRPLSAIAPARLLPQWNRRNQRLRRRPAAADARQASCWAASERSLSDSGPGSAFEPSRSAATPGRFAQRRFARARQARHSAAARQGRAFLSRSEAMQPHTPPREACDTLYRELTSRYAREDVR